MRFGEAWSPFLSGAGPNAGVWLQPSIGGNVDIHVSSGRELQQCSPEELPGCPSIGC